MCGIVAYLTTDACNDGSILDIDASLKLIQHRGPDGKGRWIDPMGRVGLGHQRLSIIDLVNGQQPITNETGDIHLIVNGKFYDFEKIRSELQALGHVFKTNSDSEIAIHLYEEKGLSFLDSLRGEFALCLWDARRALFVCARDRFGVKPLFYGQINGRLMVASEMKAFLPLGWKPKWDIHSIVNSGIMCDSRTMFQGISKLLPGHYMIATHSGSIEIRKYWDADYCDKKVSETRSIEEMINGVRTHLVEAVRLRLRADVPVAVYLSGGIDSSTILGIASTILREKDPNAKIDTFTISFADRKHSDESDIAQRTAEHCGANFRKLCIRETDLSAAFEDTIWHCEAPIFELGPVAKFLLSRFVNDEGYKVVLTGEGSDEHFAGYSFLMEDYLREADIAFNTVVEPEKIELANIAALNRVWHDLEAVSISDLDAVTSRRMLNGINTHCLLASIYGLPREMFTDAVLKCTGEPDSCFTIAASVDGTARYKANNKWHPLHTALYVQSHTEFPHFVLTHLSDRAEMAHSVESRMPYLDHHLTEYVNQLPPSIKIKYPIEKWILREAAKPYITKELYARTKFVFVGPPIESKNTPHSNYLNNRITQEAVESLGWLRWDFVEKMKMLFFENNDRKAQNLLNSIASMIVISEKFGVETYGKKKQ